MDIQDEIEFYLGDADHCELNSYVSRIKDPLLRAAIVEMIVEVAEVPLQLDKMRAKVLGSCK